MAFTRVNKQVRVELDLPVPNYAPRILFLYWDCADEIYAGLLTQALRDRMRAELTRIRRDSYEKGFSDAKAKRGKQKYFDLGWS